MSVWASHPAPGDMGFDLDLEAPMIPLVYHASHVLPEAGGERGGQVDIASLPKHVRFWREHDGYDVIIREGPGGEFVAHTLPEPEGYEPYLRLGVTGLDGTGTVILTEAQVRLVHETLGEWLRGLR